MLMNSQMQAASVGNFTRVIVAVAARPMMNNINVVERQIGDVILTTASFIGAPEMRS